MAKFKKALMESFKPGLKERGFKKKAATWHLQMPELIHVFNIQTSNWSECYYFNAGVYFRALGPESTPPEHHCHIRARIPDNELHAGSRERAIILSNFERIQREVDDQIRELNNLVEPLLFEWFDRFRDLKSAQRELSGIKAPWFWISPEAWPLLNLKRPR